MRPVINSIPWKWIQLFAGIFIISEALIGYAETKPRTRDRYAPFIRLPRADKLTLNHIFPTNISAFTQPNNEYTPLVPPSTISSIHELFIEQHQQLSLQCEPNVNFTSSVWRKDGHIVHTLLMDNAKRGSGHRFLVDTEGDLFIETVRLEDDGVWQCSVENEKGFVVDAKPVQVTVLDEPKKSYLLIDNRILDPGNLFIPVKENSELTVSCVVEGGNPKPIISWELTLGSMALLDAPEIPNQALNFSETAGESSTGASSNVHLDKIMRVHHNATIACLVHHKTLKQPLNVSLLLDVQYTPSFAISREPGFGFPVREGMPVSLKCDVDSNPRSTPIWQKDDTTPPVQQSPDGFLNFTAIRREHSGWYKCITKHLLGTFSSIGYFLNVRYESREVTSEPDFDVARTSSTGRQAEGDLGGAVQLECPDGTIGCWTQINSEASVSQDFLKPIFYQEGGEYKCIPTQDHKNLDILRNSFLNNATTNGKLFVHPKNQTVIAVNDKTLPLTVEFCAEPAFTKVFWIVGDQVLQPGNSYDRIYAPNITNSSSNCYRAMLIIRSVTLTDSGEIGFYVRSTRGVSVGIFNVNITQVSEYTINAMSKLSHNISYVLIISLVFYIYCC